MILNAKRQIKRFFGVYVGDIKYGVAFNERKHGV